MAMLPFIGYNAGDYLNHWITSARTTTRPSCEDLLRELVPQGRGGKFVWPGFSENGRVLKWVIDRLEGQAAAVETRSGTYRRSIRST